MSMAISIKTLCTETDRGLNLVHSHSLPMSGIDWVLVLNKVLTNKRRQFMQKNNVKQKIKWWAPIFDIIVRSSMKR